MGETPLGVWVRYQHLYGEDTSIAVEEQAVNRRNGLALNRIGQKCVMLRVIPS